MPVSHIQKYIVKKLDLASEAEVSESLIVFSPLPAFSLLNPWLPIILQVKITCLGQPVLPHLKISSLLDVWLHSSSTPKKVRTAVGESAKEFVMVLSYSRKVAAPAS
uniref:Uncharacterized protein n=1 Tax=Opuntia streptacantha TaxID=393608 RepID=A0A7C9E5E2_OPUST